MSKQINNGGPAFPGKSLVRRKVELGGEVRTTLFDHEHAGMTLRDYFAAKALQGLCANSNFLEGADRYAQATELTVAKAAYELADAMIAAREGGAK